jgi:hypothetical protein
VTFWDPRQNLSFKLKGRVSYDQREALYKMLSSKKNYSHPHDDGLKELDKKMEVDEGDLKFEDEEQAKMKEEDHAKEEEDDRKAAEKLKAQLKELFKKQDEEPMGNIQPSGHMLKKLNNYSDQIKNYQAGNMDESTFLNFKKKPSKGNSRKLEAVHDFNVDKNSKTEDVKTPWWSIELIFNRSNIWGNMRNFKPTSVWYN